MKFFLSPTVYLYFRPFSVLFLIFSCFVVVLFLIYFCRISYLLVVVLFLIFSFLLLLASFKNSW